MNRWVMSYLALALQRQGFAVQTLSYRTMRGTLAEHLARVAARIAALRAPRLHLVGHSLGGVIVLRYLQRGADPRVRRAVLLGSPVAGCRAAADGRGPQVRRIPAMRRLAALGALVFVSGCASLEYYAQAVGGHLEVIRLAVPIAERLREADTPEPLRAKLAKVLAIREFASRELALPDHGSYHRYADIVRPFVVLN